MNKKLLLLFIVTLSITANANDQDRARARHLATTVFSSSGLGLNVRQRSQIEELLYTLYTSSPYEQAKAAQKVSIALAKEIDKKQLHFKNSDKAHQSLISHNTGILLTQKKHLDDFARITLHKLSWTDYASAYLKDLGQQCSAFFSKKQAPINVLTQNLILYTRLEREHIFSNYLQTHYLMAAHDHTNLPKIIRFWDYPRRRFALFKGVKKFASIPQIQADVAFAVGTDVAENVATEVGTGVGAQFVEDITEAEAEQMGAAFMQLEEVSATLEDAGALTSKLTTTFENMATEVADNPTAWEDIISKFVAQDAISESIGEMLIPSLTEEATDAAFDAAMKAAQEYSAQMEIMAAKINAGAIEQMDLEALQDSPIMQSMQDLKDSTNVVDKTGEGDILAGRVTRIKGIMGAVADSSGPADATMETLQGLSSDLNRVGRVTGSLAEGAEGATANTLRDLSSEIEGIRNAMAPLLKKVARQIMIQGMVQMIGEMIAMMEVMMGGQLAVAWVNQADAQEYLQLSTERNTITADFQAAISQMTSARTAKINQIKANYTSKLLSIANTQKALVGVLSNEKNYLLQSIINTTINKLYIAQPMILDQYFYDAPMLTPNQPQIPLFPSGGTTSSGETWTISTQSPPVIKQSTQGWTISQTPQQSIPAQGTGTWTISTVTPLNTPSPTYNPLANVPVPSGKNLTLAASYPTNAMPHKWYNVFRQGNWEFNATSNSFYQYEAISCSSKAVPLGNPQQALFNSIFTGYIPPIIKNSGGVPTYQVQAEIEIYDALYPFFAGIIFNGGRWISGALDLFYQHRAFGLFGTTDKKIQLCAGETAYTSKTEQLQTFDAIWPLKQLMATTLEKKGYAAAAASGGLIKNPLYPNSASKNPIALEVGKTYILTAVTQPTKMMVTLEEKGDKGNTTIFGPYTIENRNPFVFIYHNIGFISAGCSARFKLLEPQQLVYTSQALTAFQQNPPTSSPTEGK